MFSFYSTIKNKYINTFPASLEDLLNQRQNENNLNRIFIYDKAKAANIAIHIRVLNKHDYMICDLYISLIKNLKENNFDIHY